MEGHGIAVELIIDRAQARLDAQGRDIDGVDAKSLGLLAVDAAVVSVLIAVHNSLGQLWAGPAVALIIGGFLFVSAVWRRSFDLGPDWREFYNDYAWDPPEYVARQMLSDLLTAIEWNVSHTRSKISLYQAGFTISALGLVGAGIVALLR